MRRACMAWALVLAAAVLAGPHAAAEVVVDYGLTYTASVEATAVGDWPGGSPGVNGPYAGTSTNSGAGGSMSATALTNSPVPPYSVHVGYIDTSVYMWWPSEGPALYNTFGSWLELPPGIVRGDGVATIAATLTIGTSEAYPNGAEGLRLNVTMLKGGLFPWSLLVGAPPAQANLGPGVAGAAIPVQAGQSLGISFQSYTSLAYLNDPLRENAYTVGPYLHEVDARFSITPQTATLRWAGAPGNTWNTSPAAANWLTGAAPLWFIEGDHAVFGNITGQAAAQVDIAEAVHPGSVRVENSETAVTFGGSGRIAGSAKLTKAGPGLLVIAGGQEYGGGTEVSGGTLLAENASGSATGTGLVTVAAATLGGTGFINGPVTLTGDATLSSTGTLTINNTLTVQGPANQLLSGTVATSGDVTVEPGAVFIVNGTLGGDTGELIVRGTLMGKGTIAKPISLEAGGVLSPGAPSTIQTMAQMLVGAAPQTLSFEIAAAGPDYANPTNSLNDVVRLTDAAAPFADASGVGPAALGADTVIDVYFLSIDPALGDYKAQFFAATDFTDAIAGATFQYWRLDPRGSRYHNGNLYSPLEESLVEWSVAPEAAVFDGLPASGYITEFTVVPEPATAAALIAGIACVLLRGRRR